jgi:hypothetical protein
MYSIKTGTNLAIKCCRNGMAFLEGCIQMIQDTFAAVVSRENAENEVYPLYCPQLRQAAWRI